MHDGEARESCAATMFIVVGCRAGERERWRERERRRERERERHMTHSEMLEEEQRWGTREKMRSASQAVV